MNKPVPTGSSESQISYTADFLTAFNLSFYTQLAEVVNNPKSQIYRIGLWTSATARCLLQVSEFTNTGSKTRQEHRTFSILMHVRLDDALAVKSLCEKITSEFLKTSYKLTTYGVEITKTLPEWNREVITKYPIALRINGLVPQESAQDVLYNILEVIALRWVELGNLAGKARGFLGDDRQNRSKKPKWGVLMPGLTHFWIRAQVTDDIRATFEDIMMKEQAVWPWKYENEDSPLLEAAELQRNDQQASATKIYNWLMERTIERVHALSWAPIEPDASEDERLSHISRLIEVFMPSIAVAKLLQGKEWDFYQIETGNTGVKSIEMSLWDLRGKKLASNTRREIEFICTVPLSEIEELVSAAKILEDESIATSLDISTEIISELTPDERLALNELSDSLKDIEVTEEKMARLIVTSSFKNIDTSRFRDIIQTIMDALHQSGFTLDNNNPWSQYFGVLKLGANENGWFNGFVQKGEQYNLYQSGIEDREGRDI